MFRRKGSLRKGLYINITILDFSLKLQRFLVVANNIAKDAKQKMERLQKNMRPNIFG
jgi:hypothetical protein